MIDVQFWDTIIVCCVAVFVALWFWLLRYIYITSKEFYDYLEQLYGDNTTETRRNNDDDTIENQL